MKTKKDLKEAAERYFDQFLGATGTVEGGDGTPVTLNMAVLSYNTSRPEEYGCPKGELAILLTWLPSGLQHARDPGAAWGWSESGVDANEIPDKSTWVVFPKTWEGFPVYYIRGAQAFAG